MRKKEQVVLTKRYKVVGLKDIFSVNIKKRYERERMDDNEERIKEKVGV